LIKESSFSVVRGKRSCTVHLLLFNDILVEADEERSAAEPSKRLTIKIWDTSPKAEQNSAAHHPAELVLRRVIRLGDGVQVEALPDTRKEKHGFRVTASSDADADDDLLQLDAEDKGKGKEPLQQRQAREGEATPGGDGGPATIAVFARTDAERAEWIKLLGHKG
jgi:hypothetical protein